MTMQQNEEAQPMEEENTYLTGIPEIDNYSVDIVDTSNVQVDVADEVTHAPPAPPTPKTNILGLSSLNSGPFILIVICPPF